MHDARDRAARERLMSRRAGMDPQQREQMQAHLEAQEDWTARCRRCGAALKGTPKQLREHDCAVSSNT